MATHEQIAQARLAGLIEHPAPEGAHIPRYSPPNFPFPVWSYEEIARPDRRRFVGGAGPNSGRVLLIDRRRPWQKRLANFIFDRTGVIVTPKRAKAE